jgi:hypothetical protein
MPSEKVTRLDTRQGGLSNQSEAPLKAIVRHALLQILKDSEASAAAKASAGRTLLQYFSEESATQRRGADMTAAELERAIASHAHPNGAGDESES